MITRRQVWAGACALSGAALAPSPGRALERGTLFEVATRLVSLYQASDADALHRMLAPTLQPHFPSASLAEWLAEARKAFGMLQRTSMPTYGSRAHGIFAAYFDRGPADMYLEIDRQSRLVLWALKDDVKVLSIRERA
jgi:hypothetical protein